MAGTGRATGGTADAFWAQHERMELPADFVMAVIRKFQITHTLTSDEASDYSDIFAPDLPVTVLPELACAELRGGRSGLEQILEVLVDWAQIRQASARCRLLMCAPQKRNSFDRDVKSMRAKGLPLDLFILEPVNPIPIKPLIWGHLQFNSLEITKSIAFRTDYWLVEQVSSVRRWQPGASQASYKDAKAADPDLKPPFSTPAKKFFLNKIMVDVRDAVPQNNIYRGLLAWRNVARLLNLQNRPNAMPPLEMWVDVSKDSMDALKPIFATYELDGDIQVTELPSYASKRAAPRILNSCAAYPTTQERLNRLQRQVLAVDPQAIIGMPSSPEEVLILLALPNASASLPQLMQRLNASYRVVSDRSVIINGLKTSDPTAINQVAALIQDWGKELSDSLIRIDIYEPAVADDAIRNYYVRSNRRGVGPLTPVIQIKALPPQMSGAELWDLLDAFGDLAGGIAALSASRVRRPDRSLMPWLFAKYRTGEEAAAVRQLADKTEVTSLLGRSSQIQVIQVPTDYGVGAGNSEVSLLRPEGFPPSGGGNGGAGSGSSGSGGSGPPGVPSAAQPQPQPAAAAPANGSTQTPPSMPPPPLPRRWPQNELAAVPPRASVPAGDAGLGTKRSADQQGTPTRPPVVQKHDAGFDGEGQYHPAPLAEKPSDGFSTPTGRIEGPKVEEAELILDSPDQTGRPVSTPRSRTPRGKDGRPVLSLKPGGTLLPASKREEQAGQAAVEP